MGPPLPAGLNFGTSNGTIWVFQRSCKQRQQPTRRVANNWAVRPRPPLHDQRRSPHLFNTTQRTTPGLTTPTSTSTFIHQPNERKRLNISVSLPKTELAVVGDVVYLTENTVSTAAISHVPPPTERVVISTRHGTENGSASVYATNHGRYMSYLIGDVIYFDAELARFKCVELWVSSNNSVGWSRKSPTPPTPTTSYPWFFRPRWVTPFTSLPIRAMQSGR